MTRNFTHRAVSAFVSLAATLCLATPVHALDVLAYGNDFDSASTVGAGITVDTALGNGGLGSVSGGPYNASNSKSWAGSFFLNASPGNPAAASTLILGNLPTHTGVRIDFILGLLNSWDSIDNGPPYSPDMLGVYLDGVLLREYTTNTALGSTQVYGNATVLASGVQADANTYYSDVLLDMGTETGLVFAHSASTLTLTLQASGAGWQGDADESWGVDALTVQLTGVTLQPVPEPSSWFMLLVGSGLLATMGLRRARSLATRHP